MKKYSRILFLTTARICAISLFFVGHEMTFGYFQATVFCSFSDVNLQIKAKETVGSRNCLDLIYQLRESRIAINKQLDNYTSRKVPQTNYTKNARTKLLKQRADIDTLIGQVTSGVANFENDMYQSYKSTYFTKLKPIRNKLISKQAVLTADLANSISQGEKAIVGKIIKAIGFNYQRIKIIEGILTSKTLDEMIPLLDIYQALVTSQLTTTSSTGTSL